jgi:hypothetical protein
MSMQTESPQPNRLTAWLFNPFMYIAGWQAFFVCLVITEIISKIRFYIIIKFVS